MRPTIHKDLFLAYSTDHYILDLFRFVTLGNEQASKMQSTIKFIVKSQAPLGKSVPPTAKQLDKYFFNSCKVPTLSAYATSFLPTIRSSIVAKSSLGWNKSSLSQFVPLTRYDA